MTYEFKIGAIEPELVLLSTLPVKWPAWEFSRYTAESILPHGGTIGLGWSETAWHWGFLSQDEYESLRVYCPGKSASLVIRTLDEENNWVNFAARVTWPSRIQRSNNQVIDFTLVFRALVEL